MSTHFRPAEKFDRTLCSHGTFLYLRCSKELRFCTAFFNDFFQFSFRCYFRSSKKEEQKGRQNITQVVIMKSTSLGSAGKLLQMPTDKLVVNN